MSDGMVLALCINVLAGALIIMCGLISIATAIRDLADSLVSQKGKEK